MPLVALPAQRFILVFLAEEHTTIIADQSMAYVGKGTASHTDGMHLGHLVGDGAEGWDRTEGDSLEVHVETSHDDAYATIG